MLWTKHVLFMFCLRKNVLKIYTKAQKIKAVTDNADCFTNSLVCETNKHFPQKLLETHAARMQGT